MNKLYDINSSFRLNGIALSPKFISIMNKEVLYLSQKGFFYNIPWAEFKTTNFVDLNRPI